MNIHYHPLALTASSGSAACSPWRNVYELVQAGIGLVLNNKSKAMRSAAALTIATILIMGLAWLLL